MACLAPANAVAWVFLLVVILCSAPASGQPMRPHAPWEPALPWLDPKDPWVKTLQQLFERFQHRVGFCVGSNPLKLLRLARLSFPWPLPASAGDSDGVCGNRTQIAWHLCGTADIELYYRFMLQTEDPEKVRGSQERLRGCTARTHTQPDNKMFHPTHCR